jgi:hypothetical protein
VKKTPIENPVLYYERKPIITLVCWSLAAALCYWVYDSIFNQDDLRTIHPISFFSVVPATIALYQALWFTVTPLAVFYDDRLELKTSIFQNKQWYFLDVKHVNEVSGNAFPIIYNDDEQELIRPIGIKSNHLKPLQESLKTFVYKAQFEKANN